MLKFFDAEMSRKIFRRFLEHYFLKPLNVFRILLSATVFLTVSLYFYNSNVPEEVPKDKVVANYLNNVSYSVTTEEDFLKGQEIWTRSKSETFSNCLPFIPSYMESPNIEWNIHPNPCGDGVAIVWLIKSSVYRNSLRRILRRTWAQAFHTSFGQIRRIFLMGFSDDGKTVPLIKLEGEIEKDILQGWFVDTFRSVTHKVLMGLQFIKLYCQNVKKVIVADDDVMVLPWNLFSLLNLNFTNERTEINFGGYIVYNSPALRDEWSRWSVSKDEYKCPTYPNYPFGSVFVLSGETIDTFYYLSRVVKPFVWDDVYFGILAEIGHVRPTHLDGTYYPDCKNLPMYAHDIETIPNLVACHGTDSVSDHVNLWNELCYSSVSNIDKEDLLLNYCRQLIAESV